jgi:hypothetical protein
MEPKAKSAQLHAIFVNGIRLSDEVVQQLEHASGGRIQDASYWYDAACGAWGLEGGPCVGFIAAGLQLGGPLRANASRGNTGVVINGRELHQLDVAVLQRLGPVLPGRYWMDALGNFGFEGGPILGNVWVLVQMAGAGAANGGAWTSQSRFGTVGGDGSGFLFFNDGKTFYST